jgi:hypothetical protein
MFEFLFGIDEQLRREGRRDRSSWCSSTRPKSPATASARRRCSYLLAEMAAARHRTHLGPQDGALRGRQGGHRRRRVRRRPHPLHARHDRQPWFDTTACRARRVACSRPTRSAASRAASACMWSATPAASPAPTGCPSRPTWPTCRPPPRPRTCSPTCAANAERHLQGRTDLHHRRHRPRHAGVSHAHGATGILPSSPPVPLGQARLRVDVPALVLAFEQMAQHLINDAGEHACNHSHTDEHTHA